MCSLPAWIERQSLTQVPLIIRLVLTHVLFINCFKSVWVRALLLGQGNRRQKTQKFSQKGSLVSREDRGSFIAVVLGEAEKQEEDA